MRSSGACRSVKYQAGKARNYVEYTGRLKELRLSYALSQYHELATTLAAHQAAIDGLAAERSAKAGALARLDQEKSLLEGQQMDLERLAREADARLGEARSAIATRDSEVGFHRTRAGELAEIVERDRRKIGDLSAHLKDAEAAVESRRAEAAAVTEAAARQEEAVAVVEARLQQVSEEARSLAAHVEAAKTALMNLAHERSGRSSRLSGIELRLESIEAQARKLGARSQEIAASLQQLEGEQARLEAEVQTLETAVAERRGRLEAKRHEAEAKQKEVEDLGQHLARAKEEASAIDSRHELLADMEKRGEGIPAAVRRVTEAIAAGGAADRWRGMVADLIEVDVAHALVIESALGPAEKLLIADRQADVLALAQQLQGQLPGQVRFLAMDAMTPVTDGQDLSVHPEAVGWAMDCVRAAEAVRPAIAHLLARTVVVRSLEGAVELARACRWLGTGSSRSSGDVLEADGSVAIGPPGPETSLISRRSELRDLALQREAVGRRIDELDAARRAAVEQLHALDADQQGLRQEIYEASMAKVEVEGGLRRITETRAACRPRPRSSKANWRTSRASARSLRPSATSCGKRSPPWSVARPTNWPSSARWPPSRRSCRTAGRRPRKSGRRPGWPWPSSARSRPRWGTRLPPPSGTWRAPATASSRPGPTWSSRASASWSRSGRSCACSRRWPRCSWTRNRRRSRSGGLRASGPSRRPPLPRSRTRPAPSRPRATPSRRKSTPAELERRELQTKRDDLVQRVRDDLAVDLAEKHAEWKPEEVDWNAVAEEIRELQGKIERLGAVNLEAIQEQEALQQRADLLRQQRDDLVKAREALGGLIDRINRESRERFMKTFASVREHFQELFRKLFGGGKADVFMENEEDVLESGIEVVARPPGKQPQRISLLSGGEKTMTAVALLLAIFRARPSPFCILDEVDAALDEANVDRFTGLVREFLDQSQFVIISHNKRTMAMADVMYGVTMQEPGVSRQGQRQVQRPAGPGLCGRRRRPTRKKGRGFRGRGAGRGCRLPRSRRRPTWPRRAPRSRARPEAAPAAPETVEVARGLFGRRRLRRRQPWTHRSSHGNSAMQCGAKVCVLAWASIGPLAWGERLSVIGGRGHACCHCGRPGTPGRALGGPGRRRPAASAYRITVANKSDRAVTFIEPRFLLSQYVSKGIRAAVHHPRGWWYGCRRPRIRRRLYAPGRLGTSEAAGRRPKALRHVVGRSTRWTSSTPGVRAGRPPSLA